MKRDYVLVESGGIVSAYKRRQLAEKVAELPHSTLKCPRCSAPLKVLYRVWCCEMCGFTEPVDDEQAT